MRVEKKKNVNAPLVKIHSRAFRSFGIIGICRTRDRNTVKGLTQCLFPAYVCVTNRASRCSLTPGHCVYTAIRILLLSVESLAYSIPRIYVRLGYSRAYIGFPALTASICTASSWTFFFFKRAYKSDALRQRFHSFRYIREKKCTRGSEREQSVWAYFWAKL